MAIRQVEIFKVMGSDIEALQSIINSWSERMGDTIEIVEMLQSQSDNCIVVSVWYVLK